MSEERDLEKQLRAAAEQRRQAASGKFELHPASRRVLQGEVMRVQPPPRVTARRFWPRLAWGVSMFAVLALGVWSFVRPPQPAPLTLPKEAGYTQQAAPVASSVAQAEAEPMPTVFTAAPVAPAAVTARVAVKDDSAKQAAGLKADLPVAASGAVLAREEPLSETRAIYKNINTAAEANRSDRQMFANTAAKKERTNISTAEATVLNSFQFEQNGHAIRIVDNDGSVYDGALLAESGGAKAAGGDLAKASVARPPGAGRDKMLGFGVTPSSPPLPQNFRFAASGTNVSLRQRVLVNGEFFAMTTNAIPGLMQNANGISDQQLKAKGQQNVRLSNSRVVGRAVMADGQAVELDAEEVRTK